MSTREGCRPNLGTTQPSPNAEPARTTPLEASIPTRHVPPAGPDAVEPLADAPVIPGYDILAPLGQGGMGQVFKARHQMLERVVALKIIRPECLGNATVVRRFQREARAAARLSHPNIVAIYDASQAGDTHFLAMEYIEGADLSRLVKDKGPLPIAQACDYVRQAALGLQHAHEHGLVHRDIKPANLLLTADGTTVKVLDMGLVRLDPVVPTDEGASALTESGIVMGTPDFMAPEQVSNAGTVDPRADLYSLGCTLYYLLTGRAPFAGSGFAEKLVKHATEAPPPLKARRPEIPPALAAVVDRMMAKQPADRYPSAADVAVALEPFTRARKPPAPIPSDRFQTLHPGGPLEAGAPPAVRPVPGPAKKRPRYILPIAAAVLVVCALGTLGAVGTRWRPGTVTGLPASPDNTSEKPEPESKPPAAVFDALLWQAEGHRHEATPQGWKAALENYVQVLDLAGQHSTDFRPGEVYRRVVEPAVAVAERLRKRDETTAVNQLAARVYGAKAQFLVDYRYASRPYGNPYQEAFTAYQQAIDLDNTQARYYAGRGYARAKLSEPEWDQVEHDARTAQKLDPDDPVGHSLLGHVRLEQARNEFFNPDARHRLLTEAVASDQRALDLCQQTGRAKAWLPVFYLQRSQAHLALANCVTDPTERQRHLHQAEADALLANRDHDRRYADEAWAALGHAREHIAWLLQEPEKWQEAADAFAQASKHRSDSPRYQIDLGRCQYRRVCEGKQDRKYLHAAIQSFDGALWKPLDAVEAAQVAGGLGLAHLLRGDDARAEEFFRKAAAVPAQPSREWALEAVQWISGIEDHVRRHPEEVAANRRLAEAARLRVTSLASYRATDHVRLRDRAAFLLGQIDEAIDQATKDLRPTGEAGGVIHLSGSELPRPAGSGNTGKSAAGAPAWEGSRSPGPGG